VRSLLRDKASTLLGYLPHLARDKPTKATGNSTESTEDSTARRKAKNAALAETEATINAGIKAAFC
jgi:hypothetical protein